MLAFLLLMQVNSFPAVYFTEPSRGDTRGDERREKSTALIEYWVDIARNEDGEIVGDTQTYWGKLNETQQDIQSKYQFLQPGAVVMDFGQKGNDDWF